ncbi:MAG: type II toxin-antitoxin system VapC family toxin [Gemmataceae bacterium]|nr:type II toxin-antitoxin system VapC family toxin [Gemmataceae bacterium]
MILLDTDHINVLTYPQSQRGSELQARMQAAGLDRFATTAISVEEQVRGWLGLISRTQDVAKQVPYYDRFIQLFAFFSRWSIVPFDDRAAAEFKRLRKQRVRIGTMDLKIASIALVQSATLLSANLRDFRQVPGLQVESWLTG